MNTAEKVAGSIGKGLVAGFAGTAAMTISSSLEGRIRGRAASSAPARATAKVLGISSFEDSVAQARFNDLSHWGYGTGWGVVRGLLDAAGLPPRKATAAHGAAVWGSAQVTLPTLDIAPPATFWTKQEIAIDAFHHTVYVIATGNRVRAARQLAREQLTSTPIDRSNHVVQPQHRPESPSSRNVRRWDRAPRVLRGRGSRGDFR